MACRPGKAAFGQRMAKKTLLWWNYPICPRFVLTAAHCVDAPNNGLVDATMELKKTGKARLIAVLAGEFDLKDDGDKAPPDTW